MAIVNVEPLNLWFEQINVDGPVISLIRMVFLDVPRLEISPIKGVITRLPKHGVNFINSDVTVSLLSEKMKVYLLNYVNSVVSFEQPQDVISEGLNDVHLTIGSVTVFISFQDVDYVRETICLHMPFGRYSD